jgi:hypothetical protein
MTYDVTIDEEEMIQHPWDNLNTTTVFSWFLPWKLEQIIYIKSISREEN